MMQKSIEILEFIESHSVDEIKEIHKATPLEKLYGPIILMIAFNIKNYDLCSFLLFECNFDIPLYSELNDLEDEDIDEDEDEDNIIIDYYNILRCIISDQSVPSLKLILLKIKFHELPNEIKNKICQNLVDEEDQINDLDFAKHVMGDVFNELDSEARVKLLKAQIRWENRDLSTIEYFASECFSALKLYETLYEELQKDVSSRINEIDIIWCRIDNILSEKNIDIPDDFICPVSRNVIVHPILFYGKYYEKHSLLRYIESKVESRYEDYNTKVSIRAPLTGEIVEISLGEFYESYEIDTNAAKRIKDFLQEVDIDISNKNNFTPSLGLKNR